MPLLILIAEDEPAIRLSISDYLELSGYSVVAAENGEEALLMVEKYHPHLLISDIIMPKKDGYELVKEIRKLPQYRLLPVIFLTERKKTHDRIRGYQVGCDTYLSKPFEIEELGAIIRNLLERSQIINSELIFSQGNNSQQKKINHDLPQTSIDTGIEFERQDLREQLELTQREQEVLKLLIKGCSNIEIGQKLHLSHRTIEKYVSSLLRKSQSNNRVELIRFAFKYYLV